MPARFAITPGTLLRGRISYSQFLQGYRTGLEPVLMAAAVPARTGQHVLEIGCGAGAGLLCLLHRISTIHGTGVEKESDTAALAQKNMAANQQQNIRILNATFPDVFLADTPQPEQYFDHCMANPPWHAPLGTASAHPRRDLARRMGQILYLHGLRGRPESCAIKAALHLPCPLLWLTKPFSA